MPIINLPLPKISLRMKAVPLKLEMPLLRRINSISVRERHKLSIVYSENTAQTLIHHHTRPFQTLLISGLFLTLIWKIFNSRKRARKRKYHIIDVKLKAPAPTKKEEDKLIIQADSHSDDTYYKSIEMKKALTIMERMANQNTFDEVAQDFKYWEDMSDKLAGKKGISFRIYFRRITSSIVEILL
jgi:hypothetical protein